MSQDEQGRWWCDFCMSCFEVVGTEQEKRYRPNGFSTEEVVIEKPVLREVAWR